MRRAKNNPRNPVSMRAMTGGSGTVDTLTEVIFPPTLRNLPLVPYKELTRTLLRLDANKVSKSKGSGISVEVIALKSSAYNEISIEVRKIEILISLFGA